MRNDSLDVLRILACLGVIVIHVAGSPVYHHLVEPGSFYFYECMALDGLVRWSVPCFAMLTGFFLLDPDRGFSFKSLFTKYLARIVCALVFWSVFYAITRHKPILPFGSQEDHFWYLEMLIGLYLSIPVLRIITQRPRLLIYFCLVWFFIMSYTFLGEWIILPIRFEIGIFGEFIGYCLSAYLLKVLFVERTGNNRVIKLIYLLGIVGLIITVLGGLVYNNGSGEPFFSYTSPNVIATSLAIFLAFIRCPVSLKNQFQLLIEEVSKCTFGIYLIHIWILIHVFFRVYRFIQSPILLCIVCVGFAFGGGLTISFLLRRIPVLKRLIV